MRCRFLLLGSRWRLRATAGALFTGAAVALALGAAVLFAGGCGSNAAGQRPVPNEKQLILASTTSVRDSGLMDNVVLPAFKARYPGITVKPIYVGTGQALEMAKSGNADVAIVHSPPDELALLATGQLTLRLPFAYNYFTIVGPSGDPAGVRGSPSAAVAFKKIAAYGRRTGKVAFVSRGDQSGTNKKELSLWTSAGVTLTADDDRWYIKSGQGMLETLQIAAQKNAYTLTDMATWLKNGSSVAPLTKLLMTTQDLKNIYSVDLINQALHPSVNSAAAECLAEWLVSESGQRAIADYKVNGVALFQPFADDIPHTLLPARSESAASPVSSATPAASSSP